MNKKVFLLMIPALLLAGCSNSGEPAKHKVNYVVEGNISSVYYENLSNVSISYNGSTSVTSGQDGHFTLRVELDEEETFKQSNISFTLDGYDFVVAKSVINDKHYDLVVKGNNDEDRTQSWGDHFYTVGGKVVYHWGDPEQGIISGETPLVGAQIFMNNHLVRTIDETGNFDLDYVMNNAVLTAKKEGFYFVDINATPYNDVVITQDTFGLTFRAIANR